VVSAYCLCLVTDQAWDGRPVDWRAFYIRRVFRIVPLYFVMLAVSVALIFARGIVPPDLVPSLLSHVTFFNIVDVAHNNDLWLGEWTIAVEFGF
jgi:peptidoglycan/LPS O-acetylase OafA/YrhL